MMKSIATTAAAYGSDQLRSVAGTFSAIDRSWSVCSPSISSSWSGNTGALLRVSAKTMFQLVAIMAKSLASASLGLPSVYCATAVRVFH